MLRSDITSPVAPVEGQCRSQRRVRRGGNFPGSGSGVLCSGCGSLVTGYRALWEDSSLIKNFMLKFRFVSDFFEKFT